MIESPNCANVTITSRPLQYHLLPTLFIVLSARTRYKSLSYRKLLSLIVVRVCLRVLQREEQQCIYFVYCANVCML